MGLYVITYGDPVDLTGLEPLALSMLAEVLRRLVAKVGVSPRCLGR